MSVVNSAGYLCGTNKPNYMFPYNFHIKHILTPFPLTKAANSMTSSQDYYLFFLVLFSKAIFLNTRLKSHMCKLTYISTAKPGKV